MTDFRAQAADCYARCTADLARDPAVWIHRLDESAVQHWAQQAQNVDANPLAGLTFAIKDNIDLAGVPTTAGCPEFAYVPARSATVVERLCAAGMIPVGKTNLDQFATGLVGTRSPYGAVRNVFNPAYISGGSSSGSGAAVAAGLVDAALGTDTAGSGRVPAALQGIIGLKPTRGRLSTAGVVPACRALDCVSIMSRSVAVAAHMLAAAEGLDESDAFSRPLPRDVDCCPPIRRLGVVKAESLDWADNAQGPALYAAACARLEAAGVELVNVDLSALIEAGRLLYDGPWPAERAAAVGDFISAHATAAGIDPTVARIVQGGMGASAIDAFRGQYRLQELRAEAERQLAGVDAWVLPTVTTAYTIADVAAEPIALNSQFGLTNNFMNLCDLCGITVPAGHLASGPGFGVTIFARAFHDYALLELAARYQGEAPLPLAAGGVDVAVVGAHLSGQPLNVQLRSLGARLLTQTTTSANYRLFALPDTQPAKPGLQRVEQGGVAIACEVYRISTAAMGQLLAQVPPPLNIGSIALANGSTVKGFLCESYALHGATDISAFGGWAAYLKQQD